MPTKNEDTRTGHIAKAHTGDYDEGVSTALTLAPHSRLSTDAMLITPEENKGLHHHLITTR